MTASPAGFVDRAEEAVAVRSRARCGRRPAPRSRSPCRRRRARCRSVAVAVGDADQAAGAVVVEAPARHAGQRLDRAQVPAVAVELVDLGAVLGRQRELGVGEAGEADRGAPDAAVARVGDQDGAVGRDRDVLGEREVGPLRGAAVAATAAVAGAREGADRPGAVDAADQVVQAVGDVQRAVARRRRARTAGRSPPPSRCPPSPVEPGSPLPATVSMTPAAVTLRTRWWQRVGDVQRAVRVDRDVGRVRQRGLDRRGRRRRAARPPPAAVEIRPSGAIRRTRSRPASAT